MRNQHSFLPVAFFVRFCEDEEGMAEASRLPQTPTGICAGESCDEVL